MIQPLDISTDYIFKLVFGTEENKDVLISLLNAIFKGHPKVNNLQLMNSEISKILKNNKTIRLDVRADIGNQNYVDIEIQVRNTGEIIDRGVQYMCNMMTESFKKHADKEANSYAYPKVIGVWILKENITHRTNAVNEMNFMFTKNQQDDYEIATDKMRMFTIELGKFKPKTSNKKDMLDAWLKFLTNQTDEEDLKEEKINKAFKTLLKVSADDEVREIYRLRELTERNRISEQTVAREQGRAEGHAKGLVEGRAEGLVEGRAEGLVEGEKKAKIESARNLLKAGVDINIIATAVGLSIRSIAKVEKG